MRTLLVILASLISFMLPAQESLFDALHTRGDSVVIRLDTDWKRLVNRRDKKEYQAVTLRISGLDSLLTFHGKIRSRGNVRLEVCNNPSLKVKLNKDELAAAGFSRLNDLKFVVQCGNSHIGSKYLVLEKLVYDLHAIYSEHHRRVIPVNLQPVQKQGLELNAFLLEDEEQLAERYQGRIMESRRASTRGLLRDAYVNMCLFNYLVLNTDWHVYNLHNVEFVSPEGGNDIIPIPYDFDYSGFVNTTYAVPREEFGITSVQVPYFLGKYITEAEISSAASHFMACRPAAEAFLKNHPGIGNRDRKRLLNRLRNFCAEIGTKKKLLQLIR